MLEYTCRQREKLVGRLPVEPAAHSCHGASLESITWLCPGAHPRVRRFQPGALPRDLLENPWRFCTSSLKGRGGTVLSRLNMSSLRSARRHSARLSTSFASGPTAAATGRNHKRSFMAEGLSRHALQNQDLLALFCLYLVLAVIPL